MNDFNQNNELSSILFERGLIPRALLGASDEYLQPHLSKIIEKEIDLFFKVKEVESLKCVYDRHFDTDLKEGRIKYADEHHNKSPPPHMYG